MDGVGSLLGARMGFALLGLWMEIPELKTTQAVHGGTHQVIPALMRWRQEDCVFKARLGYIAETISIKPNQTNPTLAQGWGLLDVQPLPDNLL
jgi:hypothetical protein